MFEMENLQEFIKPELLVLIPVLYMVGIALKKSAIADKHIPWILGSAGVILSGLYLAATATSMGTQDILYALFTAIVQGVLVAGASVYANQLIKQSNKEV